VEAGLLRQDRIREGRSPPRSYRHPRRAARFVLKHPCRRAIVG
jgi:hypothetical protein